jgi:acylphosphatase
VPAVRRRIVVRGRVQGVFFRDSTKRRAEVDDVEVTEEEPEGLSGFETR